MMHMIHKTQYLGIKAKKTSAIKRMMMMTKIRPSLQNSSPWTTVQSSSHHETNRAPTKSAKACKSSYNNKRMTVALASKMKIVVHRIEMREMRRLTRRRKSKIE